MMDLRESYSQRREHLLLPVAGKLQAFLEQCLADEPRIDRIGVRAKSIERFLEKASIQVDGEPKYTDPINQIQDQIGARVVTFYTDDVPRLSSACERYLRPIENRTVVPDSEAEFGYFGKHYVMLLPKDVLPESYENGPPFFELQIKTLFQHAWSEANHDLGYKPGVPLSSDDRRKIAFTTAQAWGADLIFNDLHGATITGGH